MTDASPTPKPKRKHHSRGEREAIIDQWKSSGLSKAAFCRRENLNVSLFYSWTCPSVATSSASVPAKPLLLPAKMTQSQATLSTAGLPIILQLSNGITLKIPMPPNRSLLIELIKELSCS